MSDKIKEGDIVKPVHCERCKYMGGDFVEWIDKNINTTFIVESKIDNSCRLRKVMFAITEEFLEKI